MHSSLSENPRTALQLRSAFYGMGDFMSGVSDSSSNDSKFMLKIGMQRSDHYKRHMFRQKNQHNKLQLTQYAARQRSISQRARSHSLIIESPSNLLASKSDSSGSGQKKYSAGRKSLGRACREFYEVSEKKKLIERNKPQEIRHRVCHKCKGRKIKSTSKPDESQRSPFSQPESIPRKGSQEQKSPDRAKIGVLFENFKQRLSNLSGHLQAQANNSDLNPFEEKHNSNTSKEAYTFKPERRNLISSTGKKLSNNTFNQSGPKQQRLSNGLTFNDRDVDIQSCYGGGIIIDKKRNLLENMSEHIEIGCCLELGQRFERQNTLEEGLSSPAPSSQKRPKMKVKKGRPRSQGLQCACFSDFDSLENEEIIEPQNRRMIRSYLNDSYYEEVDLEFDGSTRAYEETKRYRKTFKSQGDLIRLQHELEKLTPKEVMSETNKTATVQSN